MIIWAEDQMGSTKKLETNKVVKLERQLSIYKNQQCFYVTVKITNQNLRLKSPQKVCNICITETKNIAEKYLKRSNRVLSLRLSRFSLNDLIESPESQSKP